MAGRMPEPGTYPSRGESFYANRYLAHALRCGVGLECGCEAVMLLLVVALTEDKTRYSKAVLFWNDSLTKTCAAAGCARRRTSASAGRTARSVALKQALKTELMIRSAPGCPRRT